MSDLLELLYYLTGFWRFAFNSNFRKVWIVQYKQKSAGGKLLELSSAFIATVIGLGVPAIIVVIIYGNIML